ncbi:hypothetical protein SGFS_007730 [Streptomyces graminofaciens]|uniref:Uncharacterized protein n=1 Tax=Streptomyces graminofaciens TaxID=68212 RepID=A0ABN5V8C3_9ACTN|nr:hypothetical protein [Streptomyces graminofaciens]BBC29479.1 hypothetical protein SGFS_007730 [Streptomyces graminofaciens]
MPHSLWPHGRMTPALDQVNERIRRLMDEPAGDERTEAYARLLVEWAEVFRDDVVQAA